MRLVRRLRARAALDPALRALVRLHLPVGRVLAAVAAGSAALCCAVALAATSAWLIARAAQHPPVLELGVAIVAVRAFGLGRGVARWAERLVTHDVALRGVVELRAGVYERLAAAVPSSTARLRRGDLLARLGADVDALADLVVRVLVPVAVCLVTCSASVALAALVLPAAGAVLAGVLGLGGAGAWWAAARGARAAEAAAGARADVAGEVLAVLDGADELLVAGQLGARGAALATAQARLDAVLDAGARPAAAASALVSAALGAGVLGALAVAVPAAHDGRISGPLLALLALLPLAAVEGVAGLPAAAAAAQQARAAAARVLALVDEAEPEPVGAPCPDLVRPAGGGARLRAHDLAVGWDDAVLAGIDLDLPAGGSLAVLGPSGCGKTTLLATLAGLLPPRAGSVSVDGVPVAGLDDAARPAWLSLAAEDAHVFATTLRENLLVASGPVDDAVLLDALGRVGLGAWVAGLDAGLGTLVGSGGTDVSGGERRRLLVARALLTGAPVLLLDEPTEHLDEAAADALLADLLAAGQDRTVVVATHRRAAAALVDAVLDLARTDPAATVPGPRRDDPQRRPARVVHDQDIAVPGRGGRTAT